MAFLVDYGGGGIERKGWGYIYRRWNDASHFDKKKSEGEIYEEDWGGGIYGEYGGGVIYEQDLVGGIYEENWGGARGVCFMKRIGSG